MNRELVFHGDHVRQKAVAKAENLSTDFQTYASSRTFLCEPLFYFQFKKFLARQQECTWSCVGFVRPRLPEVKNPNSASRRRGHWAPCSAIQDTTSDTDTLGHLDDADMRNSPLHDGRRKQPKFHAEPKLKTGSRRFFVTVKARLALPFVGNVPKPRM